MKTHLTQFKTILSVIVIAFLLAGCKKDKQAVPDEPEKDIVKNQFVTDAGGWTIIGDAQGGFVAASYSPDGGITDGYIYANDDVTGGTWYFSAPADFLGNKSAYYQAVLKLDLFQHSDMTDQYGAADIVFSNDGQEISFKLKSYPGSEWTPYSVKIDENSGWLKGDYNSGVPASKADIEAVLANVTAFWIRGEYESGPDEGGLDNVEIVKAY